MACLLGSQECIDSLKQDVEDLQGVAVDVLSRVGPVKYPSWKYPDKQAIDIEIDDLLMKHSSSEREEERQLAHIVLHELVIDRLIFIIQVSTEFINQHFFCKAIDHKTCLGSSVGLLIRHFWHRIIYLHSMVQQLQSEIKSKNRKLSDFEKRVEKCDSDNGNARRNLNSAPPGFWNVSQMSPTWTFNTLYSDQSSSISRDEYSKASQTTESAFVPCEACDIVQRNLKDIGKVLIGVCQSQNLPSSLQKFRPQVDVLEWMTANDLIRWAAEQRKDLVRINSHMEELEQTISPLKTSLEKMEKKNKVLANKVMQLEKELKLEKETQCTVRHQFEKKLKNAEAMHLQTSTALQKQKQELLESKDQIEQKLAKYKADLQQECRLSEELKRKKEELENHLDANMVKSEEMQSLQNELEQSRLRLDEAKGHLEKSTREVTQEQARYRSVCKHTQSLQAKQLSLLQRIGELDEENSELRNLLAVLEEDKEKLEVVMVKVQEEVHQLTKKNRENEESIRSLFSEKECLEKTMVETKNKIGALEQKLEEARERERLLVAYPDLSGPMSPQICGTGDVISEMENQVQTNSLRIQILEEQNGNLRNSICKMFEKYSRNSVPIEKVSTPIALWGTDSIPKTANSSLPKIDESERQEKGFLLKSTNLLEKSGDEEKLRQTAWTLSENTTENIRPLISGKRPCAFKGNEIIVTSGAANPRPTGSAGAGLVNVQLKASSVAKPSKLSSIDVYRQLKKSGHLQYGEKSRAQSGTAASRTAKQHTAAETFICTKCDRMYTNEREFQSERARSP